MSYLHFLLHATTAYGLHSPYLYRLYHEVLFAPIPRRRRRELGLHSRQATLRYKLEHSLPRGSYQLMEHPHRHEAQWEALCLQEGATACLDLYHSGLILFNPKLSKQHILLR